MAANVESEGGERRGLELQSEGVLWQDMQQPRKNSRTVEGRIPNATFCCATTPSPIPSTPPDTARPHLYRVRRSFRQLWDTRIDEGFTQAGIEVVIREAIIQLANHSTQQSGKLIRVPALT